MWKDDRIRLQHMLDVANEALGFIQDKHRSDLDKGRMLVLSLVKELEIIGEAASKVSDEIRLAFSASLGAFLSIARMEGSRSSFSKNV